MSHLATTFHVAAPPEIVFDIVADPSRGADWQTLVSEIGAISGRPGGIGSSFVGYYSVAGHRLQGRFVVTAAERPTLYQAAGTTRGGWARWTTIIEPVGDGSDVRISLEYELPGEVLGNLFRVLTGAGVQRAFYRTYSNLKSVAEAEAARMIRGRPIGDGQGPTASVAAD
jgi:hypothetical protein